MDKFGFHIVAKEHPHREFFVIQKTTKEDYVEIDGTSGTALSNGLYMWCFPLPSQRRYMKYYCKSSLSWGENGTGDNLAIPSPLPAVSSAWKQEVLASCVCEC